MEAKYRLMIVDDESLVREKLCETIDWESLHIEIVGAYSNAREALKALDTVAPDLILSEAEPGLILAETLSKREFDGAIVFYSGRGEFEYARKALEYGVSAYVLKSEGETRLTQKLKEVLVSLKRQRKNRLAFARMEKNKDYVVETFFHKLAYGELDQNVLSQLQFLNVKIPDSGTVLYCAVAEHKDGSFSELYAEICKALETFGVIGSKFEDKFVILTGLKDKSAFKYILDDLLNRQSVKSPCRVTIGISDAYNGLNALSATVAQAVKLSEQFAFPNAHNVKMELEGTSLDKRNKLTDKLLRLISEHYAEKITVAWAAKQLFVSESHLMHEVKETLGKTFNELLREYRIIKAKELLVEGGLRVNEIAAAVGFSDARYFIKIFKESAGCSPGEYMKK